MNIYHYIEEKAVTEAEIVHIYTYINLKNKKLNVLIKILCYD
jgi:hypothetical protein